MKISINLVRNRLRELFDMNSRNRLSFGKIVERCLSASKINFDDFVGNHSIVLFFLVEVDFLCEGLRAYWVKAWYVLIFH